MKARPSGIQRCRAFTRADFAAIVLVVSLFLFVAFPAVSRNAFAATGITCVGNLMKLTAAWQLYAADNDGKLVNNFGAADIAGTVSAKTYRNWTHNVMDWSTNPSNTNRTLMTASKLYPYLDNPIATPFRCPADPYVSATQTSAGWPLGSRLRSYSMNGYMGANAMNTSDPSYQGNNLFTPNYRQFISSSSIANPVGTIVLLDEHPDSINDGYFINVPSSPGAAQWFDYPGSSHNGAGGVSFADGHVEMHSWSDLRTKPRVRYAAPTGGSSPNNIDHAWLTVRMTFLHQTLTVTKEEAGQSRFAWSPTTSSYVLQSKPNLTVSNWTNVPETPVKGSGQVSVTAGSENTQSYFRLIRP
jgi:prepilin-type processing-associated H-X9-DG protein